METKSVMASKINITQVASLLLSIAVITGIIPEQYKMKTLEVLVMAGPVATIILRTWFTSAKLTWNGEQ